MGSLLADRPVVARATFAPPSPDDVRSQVRGLLGGLYPAGNLPERRREQRYPYPRLLIITPVESDGATRAGEPLTAAGKHLSETGLSFFHPDPLPYRWIVASLQKCDGNWFGFLVDLDWCRFTRQGWYESGGRFVRIVQEPSRAGRGSGSG